MRVVVVVAVVFNVTVQPKCHQQFAVSLLITNSLHFLLLSVWHYSPSFPGYFSVFCQTHGADNAELQPPYDRLLFSFSSKLFPLFSWYFFSFTIWSLVTEARKFRITSSKIMCIFSNWAESVNVGLAVVRRTVTVMWHMAHRKIVL